VDRFLTDDIIIFEGVFGYQLFGFCGLRECFFSNK